MLVFNSSSRCATQTSFVFPKFELRKKHEEENRGDLNFENLVFESKGRPRYFLRINCADADVEYRLSEFVLNKIITICIVIL